MNLYPIMLFIHVSGAICLCIGFGIWLFGIGLGHMTWVLPQVA